MSEKTLSLDEYNRSLIIGKLDVNSFHGHLANIQRFVDKVGISKKQRGELASLVGEKSSEEIGKLIDNDRFTMSEAELVFSLTQAKREIEEAEEAGTLTLKQARELRKKFGLK